MIYERWLKLEKGIDDKLTQTELKQGWHFCVEWDCMLVGPGMPEMEACLCNVPKGEYALPGGEILKRTG